MKRKLVQLGLLALMISVLAGCGGSGDGGNGAPGAGGAPGTPGVAGAAAPSTDVGTGGSVPNGGIPSAATVATWKALAPDITITSVTIASPPVVNFIVKDATGHGVVGLTSKSQSATATVAGLTNIAFTLAKLVPGTNNSPSKWVSYNIVRPPTVAETKAMPATSSCNAEVTWCGTFPATDNQGTLVDNGNGSYQYTFYRDPKQAATIVASLIDSVDGLAKKADLGDVSFDATLTHRLGIQIGGAAPGTGSNTPNAVTSTPAVNMVNTGNAVYDFRPDGAAVTNTRDIVRIESCAGCHDGKVLAHGSRKDPKYCMTCHTDQIRYTFSQEASSTNNGLTLTGTTRPTTAIVDGRALGNYPNMIHHIHMGEELVKQGYFFNAASEGQFNEVKFPQDPRNCTKCHDGSAKKSDGSTNVNVTTDGDNWKKVPSRLACGACHDGINFATGQGTNLSGATTGHADGGAQTDDSKCSTCHTAASIPVYHRTNVPTLNNPTVKDGVATISYEIKSVTVNSSKQPVITFKIVKDGAAVTSFAVPTLVVTNSGSTSTAANTPSGQLVVSPNYEPIPGFAGGPSFYLAYAVPQDGVTVPADFNAYQSVSLANLLIASGSPKQGTLTGPDASGYFTATLTGDLIGQPAGVGCTKPTAPATATCVTNAVLASPIVIPATAKMLTGAIIGTFTQKNLSNYPYSAANLSVNPTISASGGLIIKSMLTKVAAAKDGAGNTNVARRVAVDVSKCNSCHEQLGTQPEFHGGARNDPTACNICHNGNRTSSGWAADSSTFIHGIHGASKRTVPFTWHAVSATDNYSMLAYPGVLKDCNQCHVENAVNFGTNGTSIAPNLLYSATATGKFNSATDTAKAISPYVTADNVKNYGNNFSFTPAGSTVAAYTKSDGTVVAAHVAGAGGETVAAEGTTLVSSPMSAACFSCHDSSTAKSHMTINGGAIYEARSTALAKSETCLVCHGVGKVADAASVHH